MQPPQGDGHKPIKCRVRQNRIEGGYEHGGMSEMQKTIYRTSGIIEDG
nr:MAG TPA: hypothetical protein [Caudoviricetes sp.]